MKKLLILIIFPFLLGCSDDDGDDDNGKGGNNPPPAYFNPVEGHWKRSDNNYAKLVLTDNFYWFNYEYFKGDWDRIKGRGKYTVNEKKIYVDNDSIEYNIRIEGNDTILKLAGSVTEHIKVSPNYKPE